MAQGRTSLHEWLRIQPQVNGEFAFAGFLEREGQLGKLTVCLTEDAAEAASIVSLVQHCLRHFRYVLWHVGADVPVPILMECLIQSEKTFLLLQPASENLYHRDLLLREVRSNPRCDGLELKTIVCREQGDFFHHARCVLKGGVCPPQIAEFSEIRNAIGNHVYGAARVAARRRQPPVVHTELHVVTSTT